MIKTIAGIKFITNKGSKKIDKAMFVEAMMLYFNQNGELDFPKLAGYIQDEYNVRIEQNV